MSPLPKFLGGKSTSPSRGTTESTAEVPAADSADGDQAAARSKSKSPSKALEVKSPKAPEPVAETATKTKTVSAKEKPPSKTPESTEKDRRKELRDLESLLQHKNADVRRGALKGYLKVLAEQTGLSKKDIKSVARELAPVYSGNPTAEKKPKGKKKAVPKGKKPSKPLNPILRDLYRARKEENMSDAQYAEALKLAKAMIKSQQKSN